MTSTAQELAELVTLCRAPFPPETVGKLPRVTCGECRERRCQRHQKRECSDCGNYLTTAHIHLDYVGHAAVTDRLLQIDPAWSWEPMAVDDNGLPFVQRSQSGQGGAMWIRLTIRGVTRLGVGTVDKGGPDSLKELIGDAIRNAAMRFGIALDLWAKEPLIVHGDAPDEPPVDEVHPDGTVITARGPASYATDEAVAELLAAVRSLDDDGKARFRERAQAETTSRRSWSFQDGHRWTTIELNAARAFVYAILGREPFDVDSDNAGPVPPVPPEGVDPATGEVRRAGAVTADELLDALERAEELGIGVDLINQWLGERFPPADGGQPTWCDYGVAPFYVEAHPDRAAWLVARLDATTVTAAQPAGNE